MRVCHLSLGLSTGGLERLLVQFARLHQRQTWEPHFVSLGATGPPAEDIQSAGAMVHVLPDLQGRKGRQLLELIRFLRRLRPHVLHTHNAYAHLYGSLAAKAARTRAVVHTRHGRVLTAGRMETMLFRFSCSLSDAVVAVSQELEMLSLSQGCPSRKLRTIWNGVDTDCHRPSAPNTTGAQVIAVGRLEPVKDLGTLLKAVSVARKRRADLELTVVGDGSQMQALQRLALELGLDDHVRFLGERTDVAALLERAAIFVNSSLSEGISISLLEATACGLAVVAARVGGNQEVIQDGINGVLVPPGNPEALAKAILDLVEDPRKRSTMSEAARLRTRQHFDVRRMVAAYEAVYNECLSS